MALHTYRATIDWSGSTGAGYDAYDRTHAATSPPAQSPLTVSADPAFLGDSACLNPEQLLVAAAASCQLLSFLAVAARARLDVVAYTDDAIADMPEDDPPVRITRIDLRPTITFADTDRARPSPERLAHLVEVAHRECYVANSLRSEITVAPAFRWLENPFEVDDEGAIDR